jgi:hypothetical protein
MLENLIAELRQLVDFKETTGAGDVVLIASENPKMLVYGLITGIEPDSSRQGGWWHVSMLLLTVPPQNIVWTLREPQFTGQEIFTMGGDQRFVQAVTIPSPPQQEKQGTVDGPAAVKKSFKRVK